MSNVINLAEYKQQKEKTELNDINEMLKEVMKDIDMTSITTPQPISTQIPSGTFMFGPPSSDPHQRRQENIMTCLDGLLFISMLLTQESEIELANKVDNLIIGVENLLDTPI